MRKLMNTSPHPLKHTSLVLPVGAIDELLNRAEALTGLRPSRTVIIRRSLKLLSAEFDAIEAALNGSRAAEANELRRAATAA